MGSPLLDARSEGARGGPRSLREWHDEVRRRQRDGDLDGAIALLQRLADAAPDHDRLRRDLITLLRHADRHDEADQLAVRLDPGDAPAWARLTRQARRARDLDRFAEAALGWAAAAPGDPVAAHFADVARSSLRGDGHDRCSEGYVREVFDHYADRFDRHLDLLRYRGPQVVAGLIHDLVADGDLPADATIADLGCGTGLVGQHLRHGRARAGSAPWRGRLVGNDLSPKMLARTTERRVDGRPVYDEVAEADFVAFLTARPDTFDAVAAADALIYVGDLGPVVRAAASSLRRGGWLVATVEHADDGSAEERGYAADMSGRYRHDAGRLGAELSAAGFRTVVVEELSIREENHVPVPGLVVVAQR